MRDVVDREGENRTLALHVAISIIDVVLVRVAIMHVIKRMSQEFD